MYMQGKTFKRIILLLSQSLLLSACNTTPNLHPKHGLPLDQGIDSLNQGIAADAKNLDKKNRYRIPANISNALISSSTHKYQEEPAFNTKYFPKEKHFNVSADEVDARTFFMGLVNGTSYNMIVASNVSGKISIDLKNVTVEETLDAVRDGYGYEYKKTSYGYEVFPKKLETKIFHVNYLNVNRIGKTLTEMTSGQISEQINGYTSNSATGNTSQLNAEKTIPSGTTVDTRTVANFWLDLKSSLKEIISNKEGRSVSINPNAGVIIVHAYPNEIRSVNRYLERLESSLNRQVILEAKVLEVQLNDQTQAGIDWNAFGKIANNAGGIGDQAFLEFTNPNSSLSDFNSIFTLRINGNFGALIKLLQTQGNVQILSSPHIATLNNQKAIIKVGQDEFFVTGVTSTNVVTNSGNNNYPSQNIALTPFFSGITLDVTPQISRTGEVILHIHPTVSNVKDQEKKIVLGNGGTGSNNNTYVLPLAQSTIRESDTVVKAKSGQVIVIGGLMQNSMQEQVAGVPYLSRLPGIGPLFRRTEQLSQKIELVILLKPIIASNKAWMDEMKADKRTYENMYRGNHISGLPEVFGNEGENTDALRQGLCAGRQSKNCKWVNNSRTYD